MEYLELVEIPSIILGFVTAVAAGIIIKLYLEHYFRLNGDSTHSHQIVSIINEF